MAVRSADEATDRGERLLALRVSRRLRRSAAVPLQLWLRRGPLAGDRELGSAPLFPTALGVAVVFLNAVAGGSHDIARAPAHPGGQQELREEPHLSQEDEGRRRAGEGFHRAARAGDETADRGERPLALRDPC